MRFSIDPKEFNYAILRLTNALLPFLLILFFSNMQKLTDIKEDTIKLIVPQIAGKTSKLLAPFSKEHASLYIIVGSKLRFGT